MKISPRVISCIILFIIICLVFTGGCTSILPSKTNSTPPALITEVQTTVSQVPPAVVPGVGCAEGQTTCGGVCRNTLADSSNCGRCGNACGASQFCNNGGCTAGTMAIPSTFVTSPPSSSGISCAEGQTICSGVCRNVLADTSNCGMCGRICGSGQTCSSGSCSAGVASTTAAGAAVTTTTVTGSVTCFPDQLNCGGTCIERHDPNNCGSCGNVCPSSQICSLDTCRDCGSGFTRCGAGCSNTLIDPVNCGSCGNSCPSDQRCTGGSCVARSTGTISCGTGFTQCGEGCSNTLIDPVNCGSCGNTCPTGLRCIDGACYADVSGISLINTCLVGYADCGSGCRDILTDPANCGSCGNTCNAGYPCCRGTCTYTADNNENCGYCGNVCPAGQHCGGSVCVEGPTWVVITTETTVSSCGKGQTLCSSGKFGSACVDLSTDSNNCGYCGNICTSGICSGGECTYILS